MTLRFLVNLIFLVLFLSVTFLLIFYFLLYKICPECPITIATAISLHNALPGESRSIIKGYFNMLAIDVKRNYIFDVLLYGKDVKFWDALSNAFLVSSLVTIQYTAETGVGAIIGGVMVAIGAGIRFWLDFIEKSKEVYLFNGEKIEIPSGCRLKARSIGDFFYFGKIDNIVYYGGQSIRKDDKIIISAIKKIKWFGCNPIIKNSLLTVEIHKYKDNKVYLDFYGD